jgi:hypothetical protein
MNSKANGANGAGAKRGLASPPDSPPPPAVADLADACVRFVEKALGFQLDYTPETLPVLDHYLEQAREAAAERSDALLLLAHTAGAYLGEVIRRKHASWWRVEGDDPVAWRIELEAVYLAFSPMLFIREALLRPPSAAPLQEAADAGDDGEEEERDEKEEDEEEARMAPPEGAGAEDEAARAAGGPPGAAEEGEAGETVAHLILEEEDRLAVSARLAELPPVSEAEYYAASTRLEVIDIAVDAIRARRLAEGEEEHVPLEPDDYEMDD